MVLYGSRLHLHLREDLVIGISNGLSSMMDHFVHQNLYAAFPNRNFQCIPQQTFITLVETVLKHFPYHSFYFITLKPLGK